MSIACWILRSTDTQTQYVILIAHPLQQLLHERASILRHSYIGCIVYSDLFLYTLYNSRELLLQLVTIQHTHTHSVEILWVRDRPIVETSTWKHTTPTRDRHSYLPARFNSAFPASERSQTHFLERAATGTSLYTLRLQIPNWCR
jgi:hypothetical protein